MGLVFHRRLAIPLWAIAFFTVALTAPPPTTLFLMPPTTLFVIAVVGIAAIIFTMPGVVPWLRTARSLVRVLPSLADQSSPLGSAERRVDCVAAAHDRSGHLADSRTTSEHGDANGRHGR